MFCEKGDLKNFAIFTGKHNRWSLFIIKMQAYRAATLLKENPTQMLSCEYCEIFGAPILKNICEWLLLNNLIPWFNNINQEQAKNVSLFLLYFDYSTPPSQWNYYQQCRNWVKTWTCFQDFGHRHWRKLRKNQYNYYDTFLTIYIDLSMKYKRDILFHYEI